MLESFLDKNLLSAIGLLDIEMTNNQKEISFGGVTFQDGNYPYLAYSEIINCLFQNSSSYYFAGVYLLSSNLRIYNSPQNANKLGFRNHNAVEKGVIGVEGDSELILENIMIRDCYSKGTASGLYASNSNITLINVTFLNNKVEGPGTLTLEADSSFICLNCKFIGNKGNDSSAIFANNNRLTKFLIKDSQFENNTSEANLINLFQTNGLIQNVTFLNNIASKVNNGITLISSQLDFIGNMINFTIPEYLNRTSFDVDTGFFNLNYRSQLSIKQSSFTNCRGAIAGVLYATGSSQVEISNGSSFVGSYSQNGDTIYTSLAQSLTIRDSFFSDNTNTDIYLEQTPGLIVNTTFSNAYQESVNVDSSSVQFINNTFRDASNFNSLGKGVYCKCLNATFISNTFRNLSGARGGAVFLLSATSETLLQNKFILQNNTFQNCNAQQGGAVLVSDAVNATFIGNQFIQNQAFVIEPATAQTRGLQAKGLGGGVYYSCINDELKNLNETCSVRFQGRNNFSRNYAQDDGGALLWVNNPYTEDGSNIFNNNTAFYGGDVASFPSKLKIDFVDNGESIQNGNRLLQDGLAFPKIAPGTPFSFLVSIIDQNGEVYKTDSASKAVLKDASQTESVYSRISIYNGEVVANQGVFNFSKVVVTAVPGIAIFLKLDIQGLQTYGNAVDFVQAPVQILFDVRKCIAGEQLQADNSCKKCEYGTYLYYAPMKETYCKICPKEAVCYGGSEVAPKPDYWRSTNISENFIKCPNPGACLGGKHNEPTGSCYPGYEGILCGQCVDFYKKTSQFQCNECPDDNTNTIQIVMVGLIATVVVSLMVRSTLNSATLKKPLYSVYIKILANHLQIIGAIQNIYYNWPKAIQQFEDGQSEITSSTDRIFSFDCFIMSNREEKASDAIPVYYNKLLIFGILPGILAGVDLVYWIVAMIISKNRNLSEFISKFTSTLVVLLFLVHPSIAKNMFLAFNCLEVDGVLRLREDISSICYEGTHYTYMMIVVIPSIIIWALGIPLFALTLLIKNKRILELMQKKTITEEEAQDIHTLRVKYGFLFQGFNPRTFYWEIVIMLRKILIIMSTVFFSTLSPELQVLIVLLIIILSMFLQIRFTPYYTLTLNRMENYSLQVAAVTLYSGMFYITGRHYDYMNKEELNWFFLCLIVLPNVIFTVYWGIKMRIELLKKVHQLKKHLLFRLLACGSYKKFHQEYVESELLRAADEQIVLRKEGIKVGDSIDLDDITINIPQLDIKNKTFKNDSKKKRRFLETHEQPQSTPQDLQIDEFTLEEGDTTVYKEDNTSQMNLNTNQPMESGAPLTSRSMSKIYPLDTLRDGPNSPQVIVRYENTPLPDFEGTFHKPMNTGHVIEQGETFVKTAYSYKSEGKVVPQSEASQSQVLEIEEFASISTFRENDKQASTHRSGVSPQREKIYTSRSTAAQVRQQNEELKRSRKHKSRRDHSNDEKPSKHKRKHRREESE